MHSLSASSLIGTLCLSVCMLGVSGCATKTLISKNTTPYTSTQTIKETLMSDHVVAFGKPAVSVANLPRDAVVIVGQKNSYVLTHGGAKFETLLTRLDPRYISLTNPLDFYSQHNDGTFTGELTFKYTQRAGSVSPAELDFFLQHEVKDCTSHSDKGLGAKGYCFSIDLKGAVYPAVSNQSSLKALSRAYPVTIYTKKSHEVHHAGKAEPVETLMLLPFAVAFDVITLPFQALNKIFD